MKGDFAAPGAIPLRTVARRALQSGLIPAQKSSGTWGGFGSGTECSVCGTVICVEELEMEVEFPARPRQSYHLHLACFHAWEAERDAFSGGAAGASS